MESRLADQIITQLQTDYDGIASHFTQTREKPWPEFNLLLPLLKPNDHVLDVGCGSGRLHGFLHNQQPSISYTGIDLSPQLIRLAQTHYPTATFQQGSMLKLPYTDRSFTVITCVAALQHLPSVKYRQQALAEMYRVATEGAKLFMLNWNLINQSQYHSYQAKVAQGYDVGDYFIPWKNDQGTILAQRYYHGFTGTELTALCKTAGWTVTDCSVGPGDRNYITVAKK